jgi:hypothetical protein
MRIFMPIAAHHPRTPRRSQARSPVMATPAHLAVGGKDAAAA